MFDRRSVKEKGKVRFKANYWYSVITAFIYSLFFVSAASGVSSKKDEISTESEMALNDAEFLGVILIALGVVSAFLLGSFVVKVFLLNPLKVGCDRFFLINQEENATLSEILHAFKNNYINSSLGLFLSDLLIGLGYCIFFIPGLILSYSYRMVPYILADEPGIGAVDALKKSRAMMKGNKWACFVYDLSYIGWYLLTVLTLGILNFFYVAPYKYNADAALYKEIK